MGILRYNKAGKKDKISQEILNLNKDLKVLKIIILH